MRKGGWDEEEKLIVSYLYRLSLAMVFWMAGFFEGIHILRQRKVHSTLRLVVSFILHLCHSRILSLLQFIGEESAFPWSWLGVWLLDPGSEPRERRARVPIDWLHIFDG